MRLQYPSPRHRVPKLRMIFLVYCLSVGITTLPDLGCIAGFNLSMDTVSCLPFIAMVKCFGIRLMTVYGLAYGRCSGFTCLSIRTYIFSVSAESGGMFVTRDDGAFAVDGGFSCAILRCRSRLNDVIGKTGNFGC